MQPDWATLYRLDQEQIPDNNVVTVLIKSMNIREAMLIHPKNVDFPILLQSDLVFGQSPALCQVRPSSSKLDTASSYFCSRSKYPFRSWTMLCRSLCSAKEEFSRSLFIRSSFSSRSGTRSRTISKSSRCFFHLFKLFQQDVHALRRLWR